MTLFAAIDGQPVADVATNSGWFEFCEWVRSIGKDNELRYLADNGWSDEIVTLTEELAQALEHHEPSADSLLVGSGLLETIKVVQDPEAVLIISDGFGEDEIERP